MEPPLVLREGLGRPPRCPPLGAEHRPSAFGQPLAPGYSGIICERQARAYLARTAGSLAYGPFREAIEWYEKAERIRPPGNDDAILRWNSCVRTILRDRLEPRGEERELPLE